MTRDTPAPIGFVHIAGGHGIEVLDIQYGTDVTIVYRYTDDMRPHTAKVHDNKDGSQWFRTFVGRIRLDEVFGA